jgi:hypothetical protein
VCRSEIGSLDRRRRVGRDVVHERNRERERSKPAGGETGDEPRQQHQRKDQRAQARQVLSDRRRDLEHDHARRAPHEEERRKERAVPGAAGQCGAERADR